MTTPQALVVAARNQSHHAQVAQLVEQTDPAGLVVSEVRFLPWAPPYIDWTSMIEIGADGLPKWFRVEPAYWWTDAKLFVIGDRYVADGRRQHLVQGSVLENTVIGNADVFGDVEHPHAEFSSIPAPWAK